MFIGLQNISASTTCCVAAACLALASAASAVEASVFKCSASNGTPIYQEAPCPPGKELRNFDTDPPDLSIIPGTPVPAATKAAPGPDASAPSPNQPAKRTTFGHDNRSNGRVDGAVAERRFIRPGMTNAEVRARIGQPDITSGNAKSRNTRWSYLPAAGDPETITTITFAGNTVSDVSRKIVRK